VSSWIKAIAVIAAAAATIGCIALASVGLTSLISYFSVLDTTPQGQLMLHLVPGLSVIVLVITGFLAARRRNWESRE
jgi:hypothetical protein